MPSLFCEQLLEVGSILPGATCNTGVSVGDGDRVGDGVGEGERVGDGVGDGIDVGDGDRAGDGDDEGVGVVPESNVSVTGMVTLPPFDRILRLALLLPACRLLFLVSTVT